MKQNYINHIALVLDASGSMDHLASEVIRVADNQIAYLAQRSKELDQETRVTIYSFSSRGNIDCLVYDKDVLRLPSIRGLYRVGGNTALIDATLKALDDLSKTPELYGEHAFLTYVLTDGQENASAHSSVNLANRLHVLPDHWTVAAFVPDANGLYEVKKFGFLKDNIAVWDATSAKGVKEAGETIRQTTEQFMTMRTHGVRGSKNLFQMNTAGLHTSALNRLQKLTPGQFRLLEVKREAVIADFVERNTQRPYRLGEAYYQLTKPEKVQPSKGVAILKRKEFAVYSGTDARTLLGLPDYEVKVEPAAHPEYDLFVQSRSVNRKLVPGTSLLLLS